MIGRRGKFGVSQVIATFILLLHTVGEEEEEENSTQESNHSTGYHRWRGTKGKIQIYFLDTCLASTENNLHANSTTQKIIKLQILLTVKISVNYLIKPDMWRWCNKASWKSVLTCQHFRPLPQVLRGHFFGRVYLIHSAASAIAGQKFIVDLFDHFISAVFGCQDIPLIQTVVLVGIFGYADVYTELGSSFTGRLTGGAGTGTLCEPVNC